MSRTPETLTDFIKRWLPVLLWLCFVFFMSTGTFSAENTSLVIKPLLDFLFPGLSPDQITSIHGIIRKGAHVFEYFFLGFLLLRAFSAGSPGGWKWRWSLLAMIGVAIYALSDEFHQSFVPTRTASMRDVGIDAMGGLLSQFVGVVWYRYFALSKNPARK
jgi:VanZ family protein